MLATGHATAEQPSRPVPHAILLYDLYKLAQNPPDRDPLMRLVKSVPEDSQPSAQLALQSVLQGSDVFQKGDRGAPIYAVQRALETLAIANGEDNPLPSGVDGVYGNEVVTAIVPYLSSHYRTPMAPSESFVPTGTDALQTAGVQKTAMQGLQDRPNGQTIDLQTLQTLLNAVADLPSPVLVDPDIPRSRGDISLTDMSGRN